MRRRDRTVSDSWRASSVVRVLLLVGVVAESWAATADPSAAEEDVVEEDAGVARERPRVREMMVLVRPEKPRWASLPRSVSSLEASA